MSGDEMRRISFRFSNNQEIPRGLPSDNGFPLYPDPNIYPPEIMKGYNEWPELYASTERLSYRAIDPKVEAAKGFSSLRRGDTIATVYRLLGEPSYIDHHPHANATVLHYSLEVRIAVRDDALHSIFLEEGELGEMSFRTWNFVFVDRNAIEAKREEIPIPYPDPSEELP